MLEYILTGLICLALLNFVWGFLKKIITNVIYIGLLVVFIKFALHTKSYRINNSDLNEISKIASKYKGTFDISEVIYSKHLKKFQFVV